MEMLVTCNLLMNWLTPHFLVSAQNIHNNDVNVTSSNLRSEQVLKCLKTVFFLSMTFDGRFSPDSASLRAAYRDTSDVTLYLLNF